MGKTHYEINFFRDNQKLAQIKTENIEIFLLSQAPLIVI